MQGSYILLVALGIFFLIGGSRRILKSTKITAVSAVAIIIATFLGNLLSPKIFDTNVYLGTLFLGIVALMYLIFANFKKCYWNILWLAIIIPSLILYKVFILNRFNINTTGEVVMLIAITGILSFIFSRDVGIAISLAIVSMYVYEILGISTYNENGTLGIGYEFDLVVFSAFLAGLLSELTSLIISLFKDRKADLTFEAGEIDDEIDREDN